MFHNGTKSIETTLKSWCSTGIGPRSIFPYDFWRTWVHKSESKQIIYEFRFVKNTLEAKVNSLSCAIEDQKSKDMVGASQVYST